MGRIDDEGKADLCELSSGDIRGEIATIYWKTKGIIECKCVCGGLLHVGEGVIELLHPGCGGEGHANKLGCAKCRAVGEAMCCLAYYDWDCVRDAFWGKLSSGEV